MSDSATFLSTQFLPTFIEGYRNKPCLWRVKSPEYSNRKAKTAAYKELLQLTRKAVPSCDLDFIKKKIDILRGSFRRECKKVRDSTKTGLDYKPKLWYFNLLLFLKDQEEPSSSADSEAQDLPEVDAITEDEEGVEAKFEADPLYIPPPPMYRHQKRLRCELEETAASPQDHVSYVEHREDEFDKFGAVVAAKLRRMTPVQEIFAENVINQVLYHGMLGRLQESSTLNLRDIQLYNG